MPSILSQMQLDSRPPQGRWNVIVHSGLVVNCYGSVSLVVRLLHVS
jgi:hypothetical protein